MLQLSETRKWVHLIDKDNITYSVQDLEEEPELLSTESIEVQPTLNRLIQSMEKDIEQFKTDFQKHIDETVLRVCRSIQDELKMLRKLELRHQYCMLFNHQGYMMSGLQSLQLFLVIDLPKLEDLYHELPAFPTVPLELCTIHQI